MAVRLAWHASGTYSLADGTGGSDGATMRFAPERDDAANKGLGIERDLLQAVKRAFPELSCAPTPTRALAVRRLRRLVRGWLGRRDPEATRLDPGARRTRRWRRLSRARILMRRRAVSSSSRPPRRRQVRRHLDARGRVRDRVPRRPADRAPARPRGRRLEPRVPRGRPSARRVAGRRAPARRLLPPGHDRRGHRRAERRAHARPLPPDAQRVRRPVDRRPAQVRQLVLQEPHAQGLDAARVGRAAAGASRVARAAEDDRVRAPGRGVVSSVSQRLPSTRLASVDCAAVPRRAGGRRRHIVAGGRAGGVGPSSTSRPPRCVRDDMSSSPSHRSTRTTRRSHPVFAHRNPIAALLSFVVPSAVRGRVRRADDAADRPRAQDRSEVPPLRRAVRSAERHASAGRTRRLL